MKIFSSQKYVICPLIIGIWLLLPLAQSFAQQALFSKNQDGSSVYLDLSSLVKSYNGFQISLLFNNPPDKTSGAASWSTEYHVNCETEEWWRSKSTYFQMPMGNGAIVKTKSVLLAPMKLDMALDFTYEARLYQKFCGDYLEREKIHEKHKDRVYKVEENELPARDVKNRLDTGDKKKAVSKALLESLQLAAESKRKAAVKAALESLESAAANQRQSQGEDAPLKSAVTDKKVLTDVNRLSLHLAKCWDPPFLENEKIPLTSVFVSVDTDGSVLEARVLDQKRLKVDPHFSLTAKSALEAIFNCSPLPLRFNDYDRIKEFIFEFDKSFLAAN